jgi:hypothetical protein
VLEPASECEIDSKRSWSRHDKRTAAHIGLPYTRRRAAAGPLPYDAVEVGAADLIALSYFHTYPRRVVVSVRQPVGRR